MKRIDRCMRMCTYDKAFIACSCKYANVYCYSTFSVVKILLVVDTLVTWTD